MAAAAPPPPPPPPPPILGFLPPPPLLRRDRGRVLGKYRGKWYNLRMGRLYLNNNDGNLGGAPMTFPWEETNNATYTDVLRRHNDMMNGTSTALAEMPSTEDEMSEWPRTGMISEVDHIRLYNNVIRSRRPPVTSFQGLGMFRPPNMGGAGAGRLCWWEY